LLIINSPNIEEHPILYNVNLIDEDLINELKEFAANQPNQKKARIM